MKRSLTGSLVVCVAAAAFTAGALILNDDSPAPAAVPAATGDATRPGRQVRLPRVPPMPAPATAAPATLADPGPGLRAGHRRRRRDGSWSRTATACAHTVTAAKRRLRHRRIGAKATVNLVAPTAPGSYRFTCLIHPQMSGTLVVR